MSNNIVNHSVLYCLRFEFGIPLEDLCTCEEVHFKLKILLSECLEAKEGSYMRIEHILRDTPVVIQECFKLKYILEKERYLEQKFEPITYFWILRHFLGLLPIEIFPYDKWKNIASTCHHILSSRKPYDLRKLDKSIAESLILISEEIMMFMDLFRDIFVKISEDTNNRLSRRSVYSVAKYFSPSMFVRPFRIGFVNQESKEFSSLLFYMLIRWKFIKSCCRNLNYLSTTIGNTNVQYKNEPYCVTNNNNNDVKDGECQTVISENTNLNLPLKTDMACQTLDLPESVECQTLDISKLEECQNLDVTEKIENSTILLRPKNSLVSLKSITKKIRSAISSHHGSVEDIPKTISKIFSNEDLKSDSYKNFDCIKDDLDNTNIVSNDAGNSYVNLDILKDELDDIKEYEVVTPTGKKCCCAIGSNYETVLKKEVSEDKISLCSTATITNISDNLQGVSFEDFTDKPPSIGWIKESPKTHTEGYIFDDYDTFKNEEYNQVHSYEDVKFLDPLFSTNTLLKEDQKQSETMSKISKIGWTYTPPNKSEIKSKYQTCFDLKKSNSELTETITEYASESSSIKSKKSYLSLKKLRVGVSFMRKLKRTPSFVDNMKCSVKYKKLPKFKSSTF